MLWIIKVGGRFSGRFFNHRAQFKVFLISRILRCWIASALNRIIQNTRFKKKKGQSGGTKSSKRRSIPSRKTNRSHDQRLLPGFSFSWYRSWLRWSIHNYSSKWWCSAHLMTSWKSLYKLKKRDSDQLKTVLELCDMETHQTISKPDNQRPKTMVKRSIDQRNSDCETLTPEMRELKHVHLITIAGVKVVLKEDTEVAINGKQKGSVREETRVVSGTPKYACKTSTKNSSTFEPPKQKGRSASREKNLRGRSPSGKFARQPCKDHLKGICTKSLCDYWHPPDCQFFQSESGCIFGVSAHLHTGRLKVNQAKDRTRMVTRMQLGCVFRQQSRKPCRYHGRAHKSWDQFDEGDSQKLRSVMQTSKETKVRRPEKSSQSTSSAQSLRYEIWG